MADPDPASADLIDSLMEGDAMLDDFGMAPGDDVFLLGDTPPKPLPPHQGLAPAVAPPPAPANGDSGTDTDSDGETIKQAVVKKKLMDGAKRKRAGGKGVTLKTLVASKMLNPGEDVLSCDYRGSLSVASLTEEGVIMWKGKRFESPSAWSIHLKRLINPERKADDGWKTIKYNGRLLEFYKSIYLSRLEEERLEDLQDAEISDDDAPATRGATRAEGGAGARTGATGAGAGAAGAGAGAGAGAMKVPSGPRIRIKPPKPPPGMALGWDDLEDEVWGSEPPGERTEYAKSRPQRQVKRMRFSGGEHGHDMMECTPYRGVPGSGAPGAQPFRVEVAASVVMMMDLHAHMSTDEIIGLLAGVWDGYNRTLTVRQACHVRAVTTEDDSINVEMDPVSQMEVVEGIRARGMTVVGWYHSHPIFPCLPSGIDVDNQRTFQKLFQGPGAGEAAVPFVGAIVGPYAADLKGNLSELSWFHVNSREGSTPMAIETELPAPGGAAGAAGPGLGEDIRALAQSMAQLGTRVEWHEEWRGGMRRLDKLRASLMERLEEGAGAEGGALAPMVAGAIQAVEGAWYPQS